MPLFSEAMGQQLADYGDLRGKRQEKGFNLAAQLEHMKRITAQVDEEIARQQELEASTQAAQAIPSMAAPDQVAPTPSIPAAIQFAMKSEAPAAIPQNPIPGFSVPMPGTPAPKEPLLPGPLVQRSVSTSGMSEDGRNAAEKTMFGLLSKAPERELDRNRAILDRMTRERPELLASMYDGDPEIAKGYDNEINRLQQSVTSGDAAKERLYIAQLNVSQRATSSYMSAESAKTRIDAASKDKKASRETVLAIASGKLQMDALKTLVRASNEKAERDIAVTKMGMPTEMQLLMARSNPAELAQLEARVRNGQTRIDALSASAARMQAGLFSQDNATVAEAFDDMMSVMQIGEAPVAPNPEDGKANLTGGFFEPGYKERLAKYASDTKAFEEEMAKRGYVVEYAKQTAGPKVGPPGGGISVRVSTKETGSQDAPPPPRLRQAAGKTDTKPEKPNASKETEASIRAKFSNPNGALASAAVAAAKKRGALK